MAKRPSKKRDLPSSDFAWEPESDPDQWVPPLIMRLPFFGSAVIEVQELDEVYLVSTYLWATDEANAESEVPKDHLDSYVEGVLDGIGAVGDALKYIDV